MSKPLIGEILDPDLNPTRDAIHVPIMPVYAAEALRPGQPVAVTRDAGKLWARGVEKKAIGIVDPYLVGPEVARGQMFYCHIKPGTVHKLWHDWTLPGIDK